MVRDVVAISLVALVVTSCTYEDRAAVTIGGKPFNAQHARCVTKGMSPVEVQALLGEPLRMESAPGNRRKWIYRQVTQRESIDRIFGIIPMKMHAKPEAMGVLITFEGPRVGSIELNDIPFACGEFGRPPVPNH
ncbi:MAG TPA: hypothetical protein VF824_05150 [Thermoanaerobaculia bacterium]|jgi:outer membrane protein assembly factor BamE (lipoprotein component of BamABCDE complex)